MAAEFHIAAKARDQMTNEIEFLYAVPPITKCEGYVMIGGNRLPIDCKRAEPLFRIILTTNSFRIEGKKLGRWTSILSTRNQREAVDALHQANLKAMQPPKSKGTQVNARFG
jgi:hypothetical protein